MEDINISLRQAECEGITGWPDNKKREFIELFKKRSESSQYVLRGCAAKVLTTALKRHFVSQKHLSDFRDANIESYKADAMYRSYNTDYMIGERSVKELLEVIEERAQSILLELPSLKDAVRVIDKETAAKIDKRDALLRRGKDLKQRLEELAGTLSMASVPQDMTVGDFRKHVREREKKRRALATALNDLAKDGCEVEVEINRALYSGLPGLSDAICKIAREHLDRANALSALTRRVEERVAFGDSKGAMDMLSGFERDEVAVGDAVRDEFRQALEKLHLAGKRRRLGGRKK